MKGSTRKVFKLHGWRVDRAIHYYIYFVYYHLYIKVVVAAFNWIERVLSGLDPAGRRARALNAAQDAAAGFVFSRYHGKVLSHGDVTKILNVGETIALGPDTTGRIVAYKYAKSIVLNEPEHIAVMDCPCKLQMENPCQPLAACIAVGRPLVDFWLEHGQKYHVRRISKEEALETIAQLRKTGHYNQAFFKVATGGRTGVICNCCSKCCGGGMANRFTRRFQARNREAVVAAAEGRGDPMKAVGLLAPSGYTVRHAAERCVRCGTCVRTCNFSAVAIEDEKRTYDPVACVGCELCVEHCPQGALTLVFEDKGGIIPLDLDLVKEKLGKR
jgi:Pyruvate/2-oxoacid:ferredoxin oxidoreductase delta subunit